MSETNDRPTPAPSTPDEMEKTHIRLFKDDLELLRARYPTGGYNAIIRRLVRLHCDAIRKEALDHIARGTDNG